MFRITADTFECDIAGRLGRGYGLKVAVYYRLSLDERSDGRRRPHCPEKLSRFLSIEISNDEGRHLAQWTLE